MTKRILSLALALAMLLSCGAALAEGKDYTTWNPAWDLSKVETMSYTYWEPNWPIVAEGEKITLKVANTVSSAYYKDKEHNWFWNWAEKATGITFDVINITDEALTEQKNMMFASNNLPDVMIGMQLTTGDLVRYGMQEEQLLDITPYVNEETMPYLTKWFELYPNLKTISTTPDGKIYTLPYTKQNSDYEGSQQTVVYSMDWLREVYPDLPEVPNTLEGYNNWVEATKDVLPHTLDEFTDLMYKFKANHPDSYPIAGCAARGGNILSYLLNAFGYLTTADNKYGYKVALRNGEVVIPAADDTFIEFLKVAHQYFADGIFSKDFFTADKLSTEAQITDNKSGFIAEGNIYGIMPLPEDYHRWDAMYPLTSQWSDTPQVNEANLYGVGGCVLSAKCANPEAALKFLDFFYSDLGIYYLWCGPIYHSPDTLGMVEGFYYEDGAKRFPDVLNGSFENSISFVKGIGLGQAGAFGNRSHSITHPEKYTTMMQTLQWIEGVPEDQINYTKWAYDHGDNYGRICSTERVLPYVKDGFPYIVYYDADTQEEIDEIVLLLEDYVESSVAKFITGATEVTEENFKAFQDGCNKYGADRLLEIYQEAYQNYLNAAK